MKPTISWTSTNFDKLNALYFNSELPRPIFRLVSARSYFGCFHAYRASRFYSAKQISARHGMPNGELIMSTYRDRSEKDLVNTLLHEMVHLWQFFKELPHGHGASFKQKAAELNRYGWSIQRVGGICTETAWASYSREDFSVETKSTSNNSRKVAALKRSQNYLLSLPTRTLAQLKRLNEINTELSNLLCSSL